MHEVIDLLTLLGHTQQGKNYYSQEYAQHDHPPKNQCSHGFHPRRRFRFYFKRLPTGLHAAQKDHIPKNPIFLGEKPIFYYGNS
jgi:hypothetical protein